MASIERIISNVVACSKARLILLCLFVQQPQRVDAILSSEKLWKNGGS
jgi:hypothetical protein